MEQKDMFGDQAKPVSGYWSHEYVEGGMRETSIPKTDHQHFVQYFMKQVLIRRGVDYYIPKSRFPKYYKRAKDIISLLGGLDSSTRYIDWYINNDRFDSLGYSLDLMVSSPVINQYLAIDKTRLMSNEEVEPGSGGVII